MHPAFSVIFFTTASGAGYGLLVLTCISIIGGGLDGHFWLTLILLAMHLILVTAGLLSSTFHLGHPERAWRAITQWRSSWLSREGILAILTYVPVGLLGLNLLAGGGMGGFSTTMAVLAILLAIATVISTAMIYVSLKAIPNWANPLVMPNYLILAIATGGIWFLCILRFFGAETAGFTGFVLVAFAAAWILKYLYWRTIAQSLPASSIASATGLGKLDAVRLLDSPHTEENYLQKEMGYRLARKHKHKLRLIAHICCFAVPLLLLLLTLIVPAAAAAFFVFLAALSASLGVVVERWLFFAEAKHMSMLYYGQPLNS